MDAAKDYFWKWWGGEHGNNKQHSQPVPHHQEVVVVETPVEDDPLSMIENKKLSHAERTQVFEDAISKPKIKLDDVRKLSMKGVPDKAGLRQLYWKLLLGYLPLTRAEWEDSLRGSRKLFAEFKAELFIDPRQAHAPVVVDHPLSLETDSNWNAFFKDNELLQEIDKDVKRTFPHLHFFRGETEKHHDNLRQILFIWAKLNAGIKYVQGMNEILAPIYYIFAIDSDESMRNHADADAFFCFTKVMSEIMNNFIKTLDRSEIGIVGKMTQLNSILRQKDPQLWQDMEDKKLNPQFYSFRWITLLLSQEFELPDVLRLWDSLFGDPKRFELLLYICSSMLISVREKLLDSEFADNLKLLQSYPPTTMDSLIDLAVILRDDESWVAPRWEKPVPEEPDPSGDQTQ